MEPRERIKPEENEENDANTVTSIQHDIIDQQQRSNIEQTRVEFQEDLGIYEDNGEADLTDSDEEPGGRHVRITLSKDHRKKVERSSRGPVDLGYKTEADMLRRKTNTPASVYTDFSELKSADIRAESHYSESRELVYKRALTLMANRCMSRFSERTATPLVSLTNRPFGDYGTKVFYLNQIRPTPMQPLKVWRGYNGSVYFEPIVVRSMSGPINRHQSATGSIISRSIATRETIRENVPDSKPHTASRAMSGGLPTSATHVTGQRKMCILDREAVFKIFNENLQDDLLWLKNQASTGSLRIFPNDSKRKIKYEKEKIIRGSVAHRLYEQKLKGTQDLLTLTKRQNSPNYSSPKGDRNSVTPSSIGSYQAPAISANTPDGEVSYNPKSDQTKLPPLQR